MGPYQIFWPLFSPSATSWNCPSRFSLVSWLLSMLFLCLFTCPRSLPFRSPLRCLLLQEALLRCPLPPPSLHQEHLWALVATCIHSTVVFLTLGLTPSSRASPQHPKLHESRTLSVLSVGACASEVPGTEQVLIHSRTSYQNLLCARHRLLAGWKG